MPTIDRNSVNIGAPLLEASISYYQRNRNRYIADRVFPSIDVKHKSGTYLTWASGDHLRVEDTARADGAESRGGAYQFSTDTYNAKRNSWHRDITDETRKNAANQFKLDAEAMEYVTDVLLLKKDYDFVNTFFKTGVWTGDQTGVAAAPGANQFLQFNDAASTPISTIRAGKTAFEARTGLTPNKLIIGRAVMDVLAEHTTLINRIMYTQRVEATSVESIIGDLLGFEQVLVANSYRNTAGEGLPQVLTPMFGKSMLMLYAPDSASQFTPTAGAIFSWSDFDQIKGTGAAAPKVIRIEEREIDRIEGNTYYDMKPTAPDFGMFFASAVA